MFVLCLDGCVMSVCVCVLHGCVSVCLAWQAFVYVHFGWMHESVYVNVCIYGCVVCHVVCDAYSWCVFTGHQCMSFWCGRISK